MKRKLAAVALAAAALVGVGAQGGIAGPGSGPSDTQIVQDGVTARGVTHHLEHLQAIADRSDGNRASGFPGHDRSANYVERRLERAGWTVARQAFDFFVFFQDADTVFERTNPTRPSTRRT